MFETIRQMATGMPAVSVPEKGKISFDENGWHLEIQTALGSAIDEDQGALNWCHQNQPDLYRRCTASLRAVDKAFESREASRVERAIQDFVEACRANVSAMGSAA